MRIICTVVMCVLWTLFIGGLATVVIERVTAAPGPTADDLRRSADYKATLRQYCEECRAAVVLLDAGEIDPLRSRIAHVSRLANALDSLRGGLSDPFLWAPLSNLRLAATAADEGDAVDEHRASALRAIAGLESSVK